MLNKLTEEEILPENLAEKVSDEYAFERRKSNWDIAVEQNEVDNKQKSDIVKRDANI